MKVEKVYAVWDFWDGVRSGFADFQGVPHYFEAEWSEGDEDDDSSHTFTLRIVNQATLGLVLEHWRIFHAEQLQACQGRTPETTSSGLPGQNPRFAELDLQIRKLIESSEVMATGVVGTFEAIEGQESLPPGVFRELRVAWQVPRTIGD
jgi:hypothetical protein